MRCYKLLIVDMKRAAQIIRRKIQSPVKTLFISSILIAASKISAQNFSFAFRFKRLL